MLVLVFYQLGVSEQCDGGDGGHGVEHHNRAPFHGYLGGDGWELDMAALLCSWWFRPSRVIWKNWLYFCPVGGSGDAAAIFTDSKVFSHWPRLNHRKIFGKCFERILLVEIEIMKILMNRERLFTTGCEFQHNPACTCLHWTMTQPSRDVGTADCWTAERVPMSAASVQVSRASSGFIFG